MGSSSSRSKKKNIIISEADVLHQLQNSSTFSWCIYFKRNIIRHVGIMIMFDEKPFCIADFVAENQMPYCLVACGSKVCIKRVPPGFENYVHRGNIIQRLDTSNKSLKKKAEGIIHTLVNPNKNVYSLLLNNCRHNTRDVMNLLCGSGQCYGVNLKDAEQMLLRAQRGDLEIFLSVVLVSPVVVLLGAKLFSLLINGRPRQQQIIN